MGSDYKDFVPKVDVTNREFSYLAAIAAVDIDNLITSYRRDYKAIEHLSSLLADFSTVQSTYFSEDVILAHALSGKNDFEEYWSLRNNIPTSQDVKLSINILAKDLRAIRLNEFERDKLEDLANFCLCLSQEISANIEKYSRKRIA